MDLYMRQIALTILFGCLIDRRMAVAPPGISGEERLLRNLFTRYDDVKREARPVENSSTPVNVDFTLTMAQVVTLSEKESTLTTRVWQHVKWTDVFLEWDPEEYDNVSQISISPRRIWIPDIVLFNSVDMNGMHLPLDDKMLVFANGTVMWFPCTILKSSCSAKCDNFPFDVQHCILKFGSWAYSMAHMNVRLVENYTHDSEYTENAEWDLVSSHLVRNELLYDCCGDQKYVDVTYHVELKRKPGFYVFMILMPTLLLSFTILLIFWIPPERPDRTTLGMAIFSAFFLLILAIIERAPPSGETKLGIYCGLNILAAGIASGITVFVIHVNQRNTKIPTILRSVFLTHPPRSPTKSPSCSNSNSGGFTAIDQAESIDLTTRNSPAIPKNTSYAAEWKLIVKRINLICFIIYLILFLIAIVLIFPWGWDIY